MNVIFFAAHPDDLDFYCSGTIRKHLFNKDNVFIVYMTSGDLGWLNYGWGRKRLGLKRELEALNAAKILGVPKKNVFFFRFPDGKMKYCKKCVKRTLDILNKLKPKIIYSPENRYFYSYYFHDDHIATGMCVEEAVKHLSYRPILYVFHTIIPNYFNDISNFYTRKSLSAHETQQIMLKPGNLLHLFLAKFYGCFIHARYAEAFRKVDY